MFEAGIVEEGGRSHKGSPDGITTLYQVGVPRPFGSGAGVGGGGAAEPNRPAALAAPSSVPAAKIEQKFIYFVQFPLPSPPGPLGGIVRPPGASGTGRTSGPACAPPAANKMTFLFIFGVGALGAGGGGAAGLVPAAVGGAVLPLAPPAAPPEGGTPAAHPQRGRRSRYPIQSFRED